ncbi:hypothetical protein TNCV_2305481 [Trichonephila clavipes]|nr:hypothetical protein TNCV_2305481 [Trichonephila clavipes]
MESGFVAKDVLTVFRCRPVSSCMAPLQMEASVSMRKGILPKLGGMVSCSSPAYEFLFPLVAKLVNARARKFSYVFASERGRSI